MKWIQPRLILAMIIVVSLFQVFSGCAAQSPDSGKPVSLVPIVKVDSREADDKTEIVIEGAEPILQYTSFQLTEPHRLIVDISDADARNLQDKIAIGKGAVIDITPSQIDNTARLEILLNQMVDSQVYREGGKLVVALAKPAATVEASAETVKPAPVPASTMPDEDKAAKSEKQALKKGTASVVSAVKAIAGKDGVKVTIAANGSMVPNMFMLDGKKLVIDIPGARSSVRPSVIPVRKGGLDKVRVGQHAAPDQKVRIVLDLTKPMTYTSTPGDNNLVIAMTADSSSKTEGKTEQAVPERAEPAKTAREEIQETEIADESQIERRPNVAPAKRHQPRQEPAPAASRITAAAASAPLIGGGKYSGRKISLELQDADLINVLRLFADVANLNIILAPDVKGRVTVRMVNIPWDQAMDIILKMNGLGFVLEDNILRIASHAALTKEAEDESKAKEAKKKAEDLLTRIVSINYSKASEMNSTLKKSLSARGETVVDDRTNTIIVKDIARNVEEVLALIKMLDKPIPQVMIEARIVEATTTFSRDIGVQWGGNAVADAAHGNATGFSFPNTVGVTGGPQMGPTPSGNGNFLVNLPAAVGPGAGGSIGFSFGSITKALNLDLVLSAMESTGEGKVISTPRISALDNKEAKIQQGQSIPYMTTSAGGTQTQFIDANLELTVTPHVTPDNKVFMKIKATKNAPDASLTANNQPSIRKNEATTEILLADGETAVIGGILIVDRGNSIQSVPFFSDLPLIGWLFKKRTSTDSKRELLIFITPKIIKQDGA